MKTIYFDKLYRSVVIILLGIVGFFLARTFNTLDKVQETNVELTVAIKVMSNSLEQLTIGNEKEHEAIIGTLQSVNTTIASHEIRILKLEQISRFYHETN